MVLKRERTPPGPITDLFDRLHELHLNAGEPGVRQIAAGLGRGVLSYTTVHNVFRGPKVPKWGHLELIIEQLGGDAEVFQALWRTARMAELNPPRPSVERARASSARTHDFVMVTFKMPVHQEETRAAGGQWNFRSLGVGLPLVDLVADRGGAWVGWSPAAPAEPASVPVIRVELSAVEEEHHQEGYCLSTIWPLYHNYIERPEFRREWRDANRLVNQRFADTVAEVAAPRAFVWVHDYQLQLVPGMLRNRRPDLRIGFFLHICLPSVEVFAQLPGREEVLRGLLGADLVGFQTRREVGNFIRLVKNLLRLETDANSIAVDGRRVVVEACPISTNVTAIESMARQPRVRRQAARVRSELGDPRTLLLGVDRLDYTKGLEQRLLAYGEILERHHESPDTLKYVQIGTRTRERLAKYAQLRERVDQLAGRLNGRFGNVGRPVVDYTNRDFGWDEVIAMYMAADVMVVTPLSDGMNLVAKEYVASRIDNQGVLVLSEFAGAATELQEAILVNPNDVGELVDAILRAIAMSPEEQRERMEAMRGHLRTHDVHAWIAGFLSRLESAAKPHGLQPYRRPS